MLYIYDYIKQYKIILIPKPEFKFEKWDHLYKQLRSCAVLPESLSILSEEKEQLVVRFCNDIVRFYAHGEVCIERKNGMAVLPTYTKWNFSIYGNSTRNKLYDEPLYEIFKHYNVDHHLRKPMW
jgi:hypothetical protein